MLAGLRIAVDLGIKKLIIRGDSQLVIRQVIKDYQSPLMEAYIDEVRKLEEHFDGIHAEYVPPAENDIAEYVPHPSVDPSTKQNNTNNNHNKAFSPKQVGVGYW